MITVRSAKSKIEHQEGLNHLWLQLQPIGHVTNARLQIVLPAGVFRRRNMSNFYENDAGEIVIYQPDVADDLIIEIYTQEPVRSGTKTILFVLSFEDANGTFNRLEHFVPIEVVHDDEMDDISTDEEVVKKIMELRPYSDGDKNGDVSEYYRSKTLRIDPGPYSDLEKKYRIEGNYRR